MVSKVTTMAVMALTLCGTLAMSVPAAHAGAPVPGTYQSSDLGGVIPAGRYSESWVAGGGPLSAGTTQNCGSWDGASLGTVWSYTCGTALGPATVLFDNVDGSGNGNRTYKKEFFGGTFWLSGTGPWANGDVAYPGHFDTYVEYETVQYVGGVAVAAVTNVQTSARFDAYPSQCMSFSIANGARIGTTDLGDVKPAGYPAFLADDCSETRTLGAWWNMNSLTVSITSGCATGARTTTWGALKTTYR